MWSQGPGSWAYSAEIPLLPCRDPGSPASALESHGHQAQKWKPDSRLSK